MGLLQKLKRENGHLNTELTQICQKKLHQFFINLKNNSYVDLAILYMSLVNIIQR